VYRSKQPFRDGSTHVLLEPLDFIARLAALVPRPGLNLTRFHGVLRRGLLIADPVHPYLDLGSGSSLDHLQAAPIHYRIAIGPHAGPKTLTLYSLHPAEKNSDIP